MKRTIQQLDVKGKKVLLRVDFNVPLDDNGNITDDMTSASVVIESFRPLFSEYSGLFVSVSIVLFAFATLLGWSYCGECAVRYSIGEKGIVFYKILFSLCIILGAVMKVSEVWTLSDIFNGLMAFPNLTAILLLSSKIKK